MANMTYKKSVKQRSGYLLVEAIVAAGVLVVGFLGFFALLSRSFAISKIVSNNHIATYLAAEGIEIAKNMLDRNIVLGNARWNQGFEAGDFEADYASAELEPYSGRTLSFNPGLDLYGYTGTASTPFVRRIRITPVSQDEIRVNSIVAWHTGTARSSINLEAGFFNWRP